jgi:hypothetical protein
VIGEFKHGNEVEEVEMKGLQAAILVFHTELRCPVVFSLHRVTI